MVTAIVVGLGGKASATSRGSKIKSFIKTGKQLVLLLQCTGVGGIGARYIVVVKLQLRLEAARSSHSSRQGNSKSYYCSVQGLGG